MNCRDCMYHGCNMRKGVEYHVCKLHEMIIPHGQLDEGCIHYTTPHVGEVIQWWIDKEW